MTFLLISFIAGVLTVLAPCILPLLPVIVGHSITDTTPSRRRMFVVITSLGVSVIAFTILLKATSLLIDIPQDFWKWISGGIIFFFGLTMVFPSIWEKFSFANKISIKSNQVLTQGYQKNNTWGDVIIGASLGPIFSACSPTYFVILATVLPATPILGIVYLLVYVFGLSLALMLIARLGEKIMVKVGKVSDPRGWFKKIFGIIFILVALGIISGYDKKLQISILDSGFLDVTKIEQKLLDKQEEVNSQIQENTQDENMMKKNEEAEDTTVDVETNNATSVNIPKEEKNNFLNIEQKKKKFVLAPDISTPDGFINTGGVPINISQYKGKKVVLLDIWTYSCINCQRTLPYLNEWYKKYEDEGLVIIGLHTPEFSFEKVQKNVEKAVKDFGVKYPVVLDNDFSTWNAYKNRYWPMKYLIDIDGYIVYDHAGEGAYDVTERKIQETLKERNYLLNTNVSITTSITDPSDKIITNGYKVNSPEVYFGAWRNELLTNGKVGVSGIKDYLHQPREIPLNKLYLEGTWDITIEHAENKSMASIFFKYDAKNVYMVASSSEESEVEVYIDGILSNTIFVKDETLYPVIKGEDYGVHTLELRIKKSGVKIFTFTFG